VGGMSMATKRFSKWPTKARLPETAVLAAV
jgi:hypothetical protein